MSSQQTISLLSYEFPTTQPAILHFLELVPLRPSRRGVGASEGLSYKDAGVDIDAGNELVNRIKKLNPSIGGFSGLVPFGDSYLVAGTDGVGTKLKLAFDMDKHDTVGIDLVAMSVNDIITSGAAPLFFLDYFATGKLDVDQAEQVIKGIVEGCRQSDCQLLGGETAEMPGFYSPGEYDLAGFAVGSVKKDRVIDGSKIKAGDVVLGIASSGVHSNGFSLVRKVLEAGALALALIHAAAAVAYQALVEEGAPTHSCLPACTLLVQVSATSLHDKAPWCDQRLGDVLLTPTVIYVKDVLKLIHVADVHGLVHITGGGFPENIPRVVPKGLATKVDRSAWEIPPLFKWLQEAGKVPESEMFRTFNMGVGLVAMVDRASVDAALSAGVGAFVLGEIVEGEGVIMA
ncbi:hypothetical protein N2152v2_003685 [Parachlorella kessleri]